MTSGRYGIALRQIGRLLGGASVASLGSSQLLERFAAHRDEAAFEALIHQHGPMVLGTCRRMLADPHEVEDAFQATFLVLARRAGSIQDADRLGPWLHGVARRVASRSRALSARRNSLRRAIEAEPSAEVPDALEVSEHRAAVDEELASLPEKYRAPLVLCYLEGLTHDEAAQKLHWPVGTVRSRLAGGRDRLRDRLTRRGLAPASAAPLALARAPIPQALLSTTLRLATSTGTIPAHVATLAQGALIAMIWNKFKIVGALGLTAALTVGGAGIAGQQGEGGQAPVEVKSKRKPTESPEELRREKSRILGAQLFESQKREEDLKHQLELMELAGYQLDAELGLGVEPEAAQSRLKDLDQSIKDLESELAKKRTSLEPLAERARQNRKQSQVGPKPAEAGTTELKDDLARLQGEWKFNRMRPVNDDVLDIAFGMTLTIRGNTCITKSRDNKDLGAREIVLGEEDGRKTIDFVHIVHETGLSTSERGLYRIDGDTLEICTGNPGGPRPTEFKAGDDRPFPVINTFEKKPDAGPANAAIQRLEKQLAEQQATIKLLQEQLDGKNLDAPKTDAPPDLAGAPSFYQRYGELEKRREELQFRLKLLEIANRQLSADDDNPPLAPEKAEAATESMNAIIKKLEGELATKTAQIKAFEGEVKKRRKLANPAAAQDKPIAEAEEPKSKQPMITQMGNGWVLSISGELDRVTVLNTETGLRTSHRFASKLTALLPLYGNGPLSFVLKGPEIRQLVVFNFTDSKWHTQDLKEPVKEANPIMDTGEAWYELGRFLYIFSAEAKKWSVLELKSGKVENLIKFDDVQTGKRVYQDGTILHIYNPNTGEWTHTDTNTPDSEARKVPVANGNEPVPAVVPAANPPQARRPVVHTIQGDPVRFLVVSAGLDRLTMIDSKTQKRQTLALPEGITEITPIVSARQIGFIIKGPKITKVPFYDSQAQNWIEHDLKEPATEVHTLLAPEGTMVTLGLKGPEFSRLDLYNGVKNEWTTQDLREPAKGDVAPIVTTTTVSYRIGRFLYIYSTIADKWAVLELKREDAGMQGMGGGATTPTLPDENGKLIIPEDDVIHIYDAKTGEWTHINTGVEK